MATSNLSNLDRVEAASLQLSYCLAMTDVLSSVNASAVNDDTLCSYASLWTREFEKPKA